MAHVLEISCHYFSGSPKLYQKYHVDADSLAVVYTLSSGSTWSIKQSQYTRTARSRRKRYLDGSYGSYNQIAAQFQNLRGAHFSLLLASMGSVSAIISYLCLGSIFLVPLLLCSLGCAGGWMAAQKSRWANHCEFSGGIRLYASVLDFASL
jgi:acyl-CoA synthetase (AMP-forming)/AMP-acid ligase II